MNKTNINDWYVVTDQSKEDESSFFNDDVYLIRIQLLFLGKLQVNAISSRLALNQQFTITAEELITSKCFSDA